MQSALICKRPITDQRGLHDQRRRGADEEGRTKRGGRTAGATTGGEGAKPPRTPSTPPLAPPRSAPTAAPRALRRPAWRRPALALGGGELDLPEQVDDLLAPADEVTGGEVGVREDRLQPRPAGPPVHGPRDAQVGLRGGVEAVRVLGV